jgi:GTPase SAR1 family protein
MESSQLHLFSIFLHAKYFLQSAKTNLNVEEVFFSIARDIKQRISETDSRAEVTFAFIL